MTGEASRVELPPDLAAEIAADFPGTYNAGFEEPLARLGRWRPSVEIGQDVLVLSDYFGKGGYTAEAAHDWTHDPDDIHSREGHVTLPLTEPDGAAFAWARVGDVTWANPPRPAVGDRVLILDGAESCIGRVGVVESDDLRGIHNGGIGPMVDFGDGTGCRPKAWAILPAPWEEPDDGQAVETLAEVTAEHDRAWAESAVFVEELEAVKAERDQLRDQLAQLRPPAGVVHEPPSDPAGLTACCEHTVPELPAGDRLAGSGEAVTCKGPADE